MSWLSASAINPALPDHCAPENDFLLHFSRIFHTCVPTPLAFVSNSLGILSIVAWLFAQLPQIYKNWSIQSTSGLSIFFLVEWCLGDLSNLLGALFTHQASWQVAIGAYYVFVDLCLVGQWVWYERLKHGRAVLRVWRKTDRRGSGSGDSTISSLDSVVVEGTPGLGPQNSIVVENRTDAAQGQETRTTETHPKVIFQTPAYRRDEKNEKGPSSFTGTPSSQRTSRLGASSSPIASPSPRTMLLITCLIALAHASPLHHHAHHPPPTRATPLENAGTVLSWLSTALYLLSRLPQLFKNHRRKSTAGLSPHLFLAAFCGNTFYSAALLTNPRAWHDFPAHGGGGWVGPEGSERGRWVAAALPFFLGAFGVLGLDASVGVQFWMYGEGREAVVVVREGDGDGGRRGKSRFRRVSGWMRGWAPSVGAAGRGKEKERKALLAGQRRTNGYGAAVS